MLRYKRWLRRDADKRVVTISAQVTGFRHIHELIAARAFGHGFERGLLIYREEKRG